MFTGGLKSKIDQIWNAFWSAASPDALFTSAQVNVLFVVLDHIKATALAA